MICNVIGYRMGQYHVRMRRINPTNRWLSVCIQRDSDVHAFTLPSVEIHTESDRLHITKRISQVIDYDLNHDDEIIIIEDIIRLYPEDKP